mgnify:CR=1 FL=1
MSTALMEGAQRYHMIGLCDGDAETCFKEINEWDNEKPWFYPEPRCMQKGSCSMGWEEEYFHGDMSYEDYLDKVEFERAHGYPNDWF